MIRHISGSSIRRSSAAAALRLRSRRSSFVFPPPPSALPSPLHLLSTLTVDTSASTAEGVDSRGKVRMKGHKIEEEDDYQQIIQEEKKSASTFTPTTSSSSSPSPPASSSSPTPVGLPSTPSPPSSSTLPPAASHAYFQHPHPLPSSSSIPHPHPPHYTAQPLYDMANDLTANFMRALHISEQNRFAKGLALGLSVLALVGLFMYSFRDTVKTQTAEQVADVAKRSLADSDVQQQVNTLSQEVVQRILTDPTVLNTALQFTTRLLHEPSTQTALSNLLNSLLQDPQTLQRMNVFSTELIKTLTASPSVQQMTADLVKGAILQPDNKAQLIVLLQQVLNDENSVQQLKQSGSTAAHDVLNDKSVQDHMTTFMKGVLADPTLQQTAGDALWSAVRYSFRPKWGGNGKTEAVIVPPTSSVAAVPVPNAASKPPPASLPPPELKTPAVKEEPTSSLASSLPSPAPSTHAVLVSEVPHHDDAASNALLLTPVPSHDLPSLTNSSLPISAPPSSQTPPIEFLSSTLSYHGDGDDRMNLMAASVDEQELIPTFTITVNNQPH